MSKGMLDPVIRALVGVNQKYLPIFGDIANKMQDTEVASLLHSRLAKALREKPPKEKDTRPHHFLKPVVSAVAAVFDPKSLTERKDIWLSPEFIDRILSVAEAFQPTDDLPSPSCFDVVEQANDSEIRPELPKDHVYGASEFCYQLSKMTEAQPNGVSGPLLNNGFANIFYVVGKGGGVFAVYVCWDDDHRQWSADCYRLGGLRWLAGYRAFSRN